MRGTPAAVACGCVADVADVWQTCGRRVADVVKIVADVAFQEKEYLGYFFSIDSTSATLFTTSATRLPHVCHVCPLVILVDVS